MKDPNSTQNPLARIDRLVIQELPDELLIFDLDSYKAHCLNRSAALVWRACDGKNSVGDIVKQFESNGNGKVTEDFIWLAIDQLNEHGLLPNTVAPRFAGESRRQILKKIGLASMVALPIIAAITAPKNALGSVSACVCVSDADCLVQFNCQTVVCNPSLGLCTT